MVGIAHSEAVPPVAVADPDQRIILRDVSWKEFEMMLAIRGDRAGVRMTYLKGDLELMSPSRSHEGIKKTLARLLEAYAIERGPAVEGFGAWTLRNAPKERGLEPDECYVIGEVEKDRPDLAIEVIWTSGGIDKLEVYGGLGVAEVWLWRDGDIEIYQLVEDSGYQRVGRSCVLPDLDVKLIARCVRDAPSQTAAVRNFLVALRQTQPPTNA